MKRIMKIKNRLKRFFVYLIIDSFALSFFCPDFLRRLILNFFGHQVLGIVHAQCFVGVGRGKLSIGRNSFINYRCFLDLGNDITIGNNCSVGFGVTFINSTHVIGPSEYRAGGGNSFSITIEDGCWIGANVTIMPGVTIKKGCIIGAGALVTKSTESNGLYIGCPAKRIQDLL